MIEAIGHDQVRLAGDRGDDAGVCGESRLEGEDRLGALEGSELRFELLVHRHRSGDCPHGAGPDTEVADGGQGGLPEPRVVGQPQVVVRGQADDPLPVNGGDRALRGAHHAKGPVQVAFAECRELIPEESEGIGAGRAGHQFVQSMITLPELPERAAAKAASKSLNPNRWVIAGRMSSPDWTITVILYQVSYISRP